MLRELIGFAENILREPKSLDGTAAFAWAKVRKFCA
jgi:hypothetical protein